MDGLGEQIRAKIDEAPPRNRKGGIVLFFLLFACAVFRVEWQKWNLAFRKSSQSQFPESPRLAPTQSKGVQQDWCNFG
jgi:hypothetical protein